MKEMFEIFLGMLFFVAVGAAMALVFNYFHPTDPTDLSRWERSGMNHYIDHGTGCEYLSGSGFFGKEVLVKRLDAEGKHVCKGRE